MEKIIKKLEKWVRNGQNQHKESFQQIIKVKTNKKETNNKQPKHNEQNIW